MTKYIDQYNYDPIDLIGDGTYGKVYRGKNNKTNQLVAVKVLPSNIFKDDPVLREGLLEEIKVMRKLKHSNIVELYDVLNTSSNYYLVQEYCDQGDLQKMLKLRKSLPDREILGLIADLVSGFTELIKQGVVHRDLKPANILVNKGKFKLADFGFAKCVENFQRDTLELACGTPMFMSPQLLNNEKYTSKCDIWSLGCVIYQALYEATPWLGKSMEDLLKNIKSQKLYFPENKRKISKPLKDFIISCLQIDEEKRVCWDDLIRSELLREQFKDYLAQNKQLEDRAKFLMNDLRQKILKEKLDLNVLFKKLDLSGDQTLSFAEFSTLLLKIDPSLNRQEQEIIFNKIDLDGNNSIEFHEFTRWLDKANICQIKLTPPSGSIGESKSKKSKDLQEIEQYSYSLKDQIGEGIYGKVFQVYKGKDNKTNNAVALKVIATSNIKNDDVLRNGLLEEIKALSKLRNPNIVELLDVIYTEKYYYLVYEYCDAGDLQKHLKKVRVFDDKDCLQFLKDIITGFMELIKKGIVHRDLKPTNILINRGNYKISDFGFAKCLENFQRDTLDFSAGTPSFMSPQRLNNDKYSSKCDVWSLGCILYLIHFEALPWAGQDFKELSRNIKHEKLVFPDKQRKISDQWKQVITKCLQIEEDQRYSWDDLSKSDLLKSHFQQSGNQNKLQEDKIKYLMNDLRMKILKDKIDLVQLFHKLDISKDQNLQFKEFAQLYAKIDKTLTREEMQQIFDKIDLNGNGSVDLDEFTQWLSKYNISNQIKKPPPPPIDKPAMNQSAMNLSDKWNRFLNGLGYETYNGITKVDKIIIKLKISVATYRIDLYKLFDKYDRNRDNLLDLKEFTLLIKKLDQRLDPNQIYKVFQFFDDDSSGEISFIEFKTALESHPRVYQIMIYFIKRFQSAKNLHSFADLEEPQRYGTSKHDHSSKQQSKGATTKPPVPIQQQQQQQFMAQNQNWQQQPMNYQPPQNNNMQWNQQINQPPPPTNKHSKSPKNQPIQSNQWNAQPPNYNQPSTTKNPDPSYNQWNQNSYNAPPQQQQYQYPQQQQYPQQNQFQQQQPQNNQWNQQQSQVNTKQGDTHKHKTKNNDNMAESFGDVNQWQGYNSRDAQHNYGNSNIESSSAFGPPIKVKK